MPEQFQRIAEYAQRGSALEGAASLRARGTRRLRRRRAGQTVLGTGALAVVTGLGVNLATAAPAPTHVGPATGGTTTAVPTPTVIRGTPRPVPTSTSATVMSTPTPTSTYGAYGLPTVDASGEPTVDASGVPTVDASGLPTVDASGVPTVDTSGVPTPTVTASASK